MIFLNDRQVNVHNLRSGALSPDTPDLTTGGYEPQTQVLEILILSLQGPFELPRVDNKPEDEKIFLNDRQVMSMFWADWGRYVISTMTMLTNALKNAACDEHFLAVR